jgi:hypothetical protein
MLGVTAVLIRLIAAVRVIYLAGKTAALAVVKTISVVNNCRNQVQAV